MTDILSKIKNPWQFLYLAFTKRPKLVIAVTLIVVVGVIVLFNFSCDSKGVVIKPSVKVEVKK